MNKLSINVLPGQQIEASTTNTIVAKINEIIDNPLSGGGLIETTWQELKNLKDNSQLSPGTLYRIVDYVTTTDELGSISANHRFDIVVTATGKNSLNENAKACKHEFTNEEKLIYSLEELHYFDNNNLDAWEIKYSLENDEDRFGWASDRTETEIINIPLKVYAYFNDAFGSLEFTFEKIDNGEVCYSRSDEGQDKHYLFFFKNINTGAVYGKDFKYSELGAASTSSAYLISDVINIVNVSGVYQAYTVYPGKGVIYYMKDEFNNECGYDFKNILFLKDGLYMYTFSMANPNNVLRATDWYDYNILWYFTQEAGIGLFDSQNYLEKGLRSSSQNPMYFELMSLHSSEIPEYPIKFTQKSWGLYREYNLYLKTLPTSTQSLEFGLSNVNAQFYDMWTNGTSEICVPDDGKSGLCTISNINGSGSISFDTNSIILDSSLKDLNLIHHNIIKDNYIYTNDTYEVECSNILRTDVESEIKHLPFNIFFGTHNYNNYIGVNCRSNYFNGFCVNNKLLDHCYFNVFNGSNEANTLEFGCMQNMLCTMASTNNFKHYNINNELSFLASSNTLGYGCHSIFIGCHSTHHVFGDRCQQIYLGPWKASFLIPPYKAFCIFCRDNNTSVNDIFNQCLGKDGREYSPVENSNIDIKLYDMYRINNTYYCSFYKIDNGGKRTECGYAVSGEDYLAYCLPGSSNWSKGSL